MLARALLRRNGLSPVARPNRFIFELPKTVISLEKTMSKKVFEILLNYPDSKEEKEMECEEGVREAGRSHTQLNSLGWELLGLTTSYTGPPDCFTLQVPVEDLLCAGH